MRRGWMLGWGLVALSSIHLASSTAVAEFWPGAAEQIEETLSAGNERERRVAARRLARLSPMVARPGVRKALLDEDREVRMIALATARFFGFHDLSELVFDLLGSLDPFERAEAVGLLALKPGEEALARLETLTSDADRNVRREVALALGRVPDALASTATSKLLSMLDDAEPEVRVEVASSLGKLGQSAGALALAARLKDPDAEVRAQVALALGAIGSDSAIVALQVALLDPQDSVVTAVATSLGALGSEQAILGLVAIAQNAPERPQAREALRSLILLSSDESAKEHVLDLFESPEHHALVRNFLSEPLPQSAPVLEACVKAFSSDLALACARALLKLGGGPEVVMEAQRKGRLSEALLLPLFGGHSAQAMIVYALEQLAHGGPSDQRAALNYLQSLNSLPVAAEGPLLEALLQRGRSAHEVARLLSILGAIEGNQEHDELGAYLTSTEEEVRRAAAEAWVRRGGTGVRLKELLLGERAVAMGALSGLSHGMTQKQAVVLWGLFAEGTSGRQRALASVFWAMPSQLPSSVVKGLRREFTQAAGGDRDALLYPLVRSGNAEVWSEIQETGSRADKLKFAQLAWYVPESTPAIRTLLESTDPHVASLAALALGRNGTGKDAQLLVDVAQSSRAYVARAAALRALHFLVLRGKVKSLPSELFSEERCNSPHDNLRANTLTLSSSLGRDCAGRTLAETLLRDRDARMRLLAAKLLRSRDKNAPALRKCAFYEPRVEIARACRGEDLSYEPVKASRLPYRIEEVRGRDAPLRLSTVGIRVGGNALGESNIESFSLRLMTDRRGHVVIPRDGQKLVDIDWYF